jgi:hypothetical protein
MLLKAASAIKKLFLKLLINHMNGFLKAAIVGNVTSFSCFLEPIHFCNYRHSVKSDKLFQAFNKWHGKRNYF